jgi:DNA-binding NarL/FixJ family response regulator
VGRSRNRRGCGGPAIRAGAYGYLLKGAGRDELARAVSAVSESELIMGPGIAKRARMFFTPKTAPAMVPAFPELSERERQVLDLLAQGYGNAAIAQRLFITPKTARNHVSNIFTKLHVADRAQAIVRAREAGLGGERPAVQHEHPANDSSSHPAAERHPPEEDEQVRT